jgi:CRISPR-associated endonuclease/helicase Cas3
MLANSYQKQPLDLHLIATMKTAMYCAVRMGVKDQDLINIAGLSGLLHDIGKCTKYFQNITLANEHFNTDLITQHYPNYNNKNVLYPRHNEIAWLYSIYHAKSKAKKGETKFKDIGPQAIYWHHGTFLKNSDILDQKSPRTTQSIINELSVFNTNELDIVFDQIDKILASIELPFDVSKYLDPEIDDSTVTISRLYEEDKNVGDITNAQRMVVRSCVIFADHLVSSLSSEELITLIDNPSYYFEDESDNANYIFKAPDNYNIERFKLQKDIIDQCQQTTIVKAPAGFGKSLIGVMWGAKQKGRIYWVCPRNTVAEGVYHNILQELKTFNIPLSVELFLTSERKECTNPEIPDCKSDIIVTNIDNLLSPMISQKATNRLFDVNIGNVVFDEFHEFLNDEALFGAFIVYMKARNIICTNTKTLLLSATPSIFNNFWDGSDNKTTILPSVDNHYPAQHNELYRFVFGEEFVCSPKQSSLTMYSSINNVQGYYKEGYTDIIHSKYSDEDRAEKTQAILKKFGKNGDKNGIVISAPVLQAALDISFTELSKTIESPEADIQTIGRINRWGEEKKECVLNFLDLTKDKSERCAIVARYNLELTKHWRDFLIENVSDPVSLNEIYSLYNRFNQENYKDIFNFVSDGYKKAIEKLTTFFPVQKTYESVEGKRISAKTLRNSCASYFLVVKDRNLKTWCNFTISAQEFEMEKILKDNRDKLENSTLKTVWESLEKVKDTQGENVYDYSDLINKFFGKKAKKQKFTAEDLKRFAKCSQTPLPIWSMVYDKNLGLIKK